MALRAEIRRAGDRRMLGGILAGAFIALVAANFAWLYPLLAAQTIPYEAWRDRISTLKNSPCSPVTPS